MNPLVRIMAVAISIAFGVMAAGYLFAEAWFGALLAFLWVSVWLGNLLRQASQAEPEGLPVFHRIGSSALLGYVLLIIFGVWEGVWPGWLLVGLTAVITAWDLEYYIYRLRDVHDPDMIRSMSSSHLRGLILVLVTGFLLGSAALVFHYSLNFGLALLVAVLAILSITRFVGAFKQIEN